MILLLFQPAALWVCLAGEYVHQTATNLFVHECVSSCGDWIGPDASGAIVCSAMPCVSQGLFHTFGTNVCVEDCAPDTVASPGLFECSSSPPGLVVWAGAYTSGPVCYPVSLGIAASVCNDECEWGVLPGKQCASSSAECPERQVLGTDVYCVSCPWFYEQAGGVRDCVPYCPQYFTSSSAACLDDCDFVAGFRMCSSGCDYLASGSQKICATCVIYRQAGADKECLSQCAGLLDTATGECVLSSAPAGCAFVSLLENNAYSCQSACLGVVTGTVTLLGTEFLVCGEVCPSEAPYSSGGTCIALCTEQASLAAGDFYECRAIQAGEVLLKTQDGEFALPAAAGCPGLWILVTTGAGHQTQCVAECPAGSIANFETLECVSVPPTKFASYGTFKAIVVCSQQFIQLPDGSIQCLSDCPSGYLEAADGECIETDQCDEASGLAVIGLKCVFIEDGKTYINVGAGKVALADGCAQFAEQKSIASVSYFVCTETCSHGAVPTGPQASGLLLICASAPGCLLQAPGICVAAGYLCARENATHCLNACGIDAPYSLSGGCVSLAVPGLYYSMELLVAYSTLPAGSVYETSPGNAKIERSTCGGYLTPEKECVQSCPVGASYYAQGSRDCLQDLPSGRKTWPGPGVSVEVLSACFAHEEGAEKCIAWCPSQLAPSASIGATWECVSKCEDLAATPYIDGLYCMPGCAGSYIQTAVGPVCASECPFINSIGECVVSCPDYWKAVAGGQKECVSSCPASQVTPAAECTVCSEYWLEEGGVGVCLSACPQEFPAYLDTKQCVQKCANHGQSLEAVGQNCIASCVPAQSFFMSSNGESVCVFGGQQCPFYAIEDASGQLKCVPKCPGGFQFVHDAGGAPICLDICPGIAAHYHMVTTSVRLCSTSCDYFSLPSPSLECASNCSLPGGQCFSHSDGTIATACQAGFLQSLNPPSLPFVEEPVCVAACMPPLYSHLNLYCSWNCTVFTSPTDGVICIPNENLCPATDAFLAVETTVDGHKQCIQECPPDQGAVLVQGIPHCSTCSSLPGYMVETYLTFQYKNCLEACPATEPYFSQDEDFTNQAGEIIRRCVSTCPQFVEEGLCVSECQARLFVTSPAGHKICLPPDQQQCQSYFVVWSDGVHAECLEACPTDAVALQLSTRGIECSESYTGFYVSAGGPKNATLCTGSRLSTGECVTLCPSKAAPITQAESSHLCVNTCLQVGQRISSIVPDACTAFICTDEASDAFSFTNATEELCTTECDVSLGLCVRKDAGGACPGARPYFTELQAGSTHWRKECAVTCASLAPVGTLHSVVENSNECAQCPLTAPVTQGTPLRCWPRGCPAARPFIHGTVLVGPDSHPRCVLACPPTEPFIEIDGICGKGCASRSFFVSGTDKRCAKDRCKGFYLQTFDMDNNVLTQCTAACPSVRPFARGRECVAWCEYFTRGPDGVLYCEPQCPVYFKASPEGKECMQHCPNFIKDGECVDEFQDHSLVSLDGQSAVFPCPIGSAIAEDGLRCDASCAFVGFEQGGVEVEYCWDISSTEAAEALSHKCPKSAPYLSQITPGRFKCIEECPVYFVGQVCTDQCPGDAAGLIGKECVRNCPVYLFAGECVSQCPAGHVISIDNKCVPDCPAGQAVKLMVENAVTILRCSEGCLWYQSTELGRKTCAQICPPDTPFLEPPDPTAATDEGFHCADECASGFATENLVCEESCTDFVFALSEKATQICATSCPPSQPYALGQTCQTACPPTTYTDTVTMECVADCTRAICGVLCVPNCSVCPELPYLEGDICVAECAHLSVESVCSMECPAENVNLGPHCVSFCPPGYVVVEGSCLLAEECSRDHTGVCATRQRTYATGNARLGLVAVGVIGAIGAIGVVSLCFIVVGVIQILRKPRGMLKLSAELQADPVVLSKKQFQVGGPQETTRE